MIEKPVIIDAVDKNIRVTVVVETPEAFAKRVKDGHMVKYAKIIEKKLHRPHNYEFTDDGNLKFSVLFENPLTIGGVVAVTTAISQLADIVVDSVMAAPRLNGAISFINSSSETDDDTKAENWEEQ